MDCILKMKIEFGCGETPTKVGFKTCDIRALPGVDFFCPAWEIENLVGESSVDEIFSRHFFEHLTFKQGEKVISVWYKILKTNGILEMILPNMSFHVNQWLNKRKDPKEFNHAKAGFWGWQRGSFEEVWDVHKSGYDFDLLSDLLRLNNFNGIQSLERLESKHLHIKCHKS
jgi:predicted SAM-dependent methyltransferase